MSEYIFQFPNNFLESFQPMFFLKLNLSESLHFPLALLHLSLVELELTHPQCQLEAWLNLLGKFPTLLEAKSDSGGTKY